MIRKSSWFLALFIVPLLASGCYRTEQFVHTPPLSQKMSRIIEGKTTRQEVIQYLGEPDMVVDGTSPTVQFGGTLWRFQQALRHKRAEIARGLARGKTNQKTTVQFDPDEWEKLQSYSSINEQFIAFVYWEMHTSRH